MNKPDLNNPSSSSLPGEDAVLAQRIQTVMMPRCLPSFEGLELGMFSVAGREPGGDLFDIIRISDDVVAFLLFEVQGSGISSILISAMAKVCFTNHVRQGVSPLSVIERVHEELARDVSMELHLSAFIGYLDLHDNLLTYCSTGVIAPVLYRRGSLTIEKLQGCSRLVGSAGREGEQFDEERVYLAQGDSLVLFSDGLYGLMGSSGTGKTEMQTKAAAFILEEMQSAGGAQLVNRISELAAGRGTVDDDVSVVFAEILTQSRKDQLKEKLGFATEDTVYLQFLNYLEEMDQVTATILTAMDIAGYPDERIRKMKIVLTELLVNSITHGNNRDYAKRVVVGHIIDRKKAVISILDEGKGFDPSGIPDPTLPENLEKPCGRGLFIVRHYVDSVSFNETGNRVKVVITSQNIV